MTTPRFARAAAITLSARVTSLLISFATSVILARFLGPKGRGAYALAILLPALMVSLTNLGIGPATAYHVAQGRFPLRRILGTGLLVSLSLSVLSTGIGILVVVLLHGRLFPGVERAVLLLGLASVPIALVSELLRNFLLGAQRFVAYNMATVLGAILFLVLLALAVGTTSGGVRGALLAGIAAALLTSAALLAWSVKLAGGLPAAPDRRFLMHASSYGLQAYFAGILDLLNSRADVLIMGVLLNPAAVGFYSVGVALVEQLWLVSTSAGTVLFPRIAAETDEERRKAFTPLVARTVLWTAVVGAIAVLVFSRWILTVLYSEAYLPSVKPLRALLPGVVTFSVARVLANDLAGRGRVMLNNCVAILTVTSNVILNILWIPRFGIVGAAWASTVSYSATFLAQLVLYCRVSGNRWTSIVIPQHGDGRVYWSALSSLASKRRRQSLRRL